MESTIHSTNATAQRKIIHVDADSFYASVEMREDPELRSRPIAVGGKPNSRGVIATCNYQARQYGVHSAMPCSHAQRLCPELVFVAPNFPLYKQVSQQMRAIFSRYSEQIEPLSLDEAYLDVTHCTQHGGSATRIAQAIRQDIKQELALSVSAGVAPNKFLAKIASDWRKPDGLFVITPSEVSSFLLTLPVGKINGVGKVTTQKLKSMGVENCADLQQLPLETLCGTFGKQGRRLYELCRGIDKRPVQTSRERKSLSVEHTYAQDVHDHQELVDKSRRLFEELQQRFEKLEHVRAVNKRFVKVKFANFNQTTLEQSINASQHGWQDFEAYQEMLIKALSRASHNKAVRLLGMGVRFVGATQTSQLQQLDLFID